MSLIDREKLLEELSKEQGDEMYVARAAYLIMDAPDAVKREGWKLVPEYATHEMCEAAHFGPNCAEDKLRASDRQFWEDCYSAMIKAAPSDKE
jgi:hypothetical protein